jgi:dephospho-CoA kinase
MIQMSKILLIGPSGSGKTFISKTLREKGVNAYDADMIEGFFAWVDKAGKGFAN